MGATKSFLTHVSIALSLDLALDRNARASSPPFQDSSAAATRPAHAANQGEGAPTLEQIRARLEEMERHLESQDRTIANLRAQLAASESRAARPTDVDAAIAALAKDLEARVRSLESRPYRPSSYEVVYDKGIVLRPLDSVKNPFEMRVNGRLQLRYVNFEPAAEKWFDQTGTARPITRVSEIELERGRLTFSGFMIEKNWQYFLNIDYDTDDGHVLQAHDYWVDYVVSDALAVYVGKAFVPGSRDWLNGSTTTRFADRSLATTFFRPDRTVGIWAEGALVKDTLWYRAMWGNGFQSSDVPPSGLDSHSMVSGTVWSDPLAPYGRGYSDLENHVDPALRIGTSLTWASEGASPSGGPTSEENFLRLSDGTQLIATGALAPNTTVNRFDVTLWAVDAAFKWQGFSFDGEFFARWTSNIGANQPLPIHDFFDDGFYLEAGYLVVPKKIEVNARTSQIWGAYGDASEYALGLNWFVDGTHNYKFTLDATLLDGSPANNAGPNYRAGDKGVLYRFQFQIAF